MAIEEAITFNYSFSERKETLHNTYVCPLKDAGQFQNIKISMRGNKVILVKEEAQHVIKMSLENPQSGGLTPKPRINHGPTRLPHTCACPVPAAKVLRTGDLTAPLLPHLE